MYDVCKRLFDILLSGTLLVLLAPLLVPIAVLLRFTGEGEIFYLQTRIGHRNQRFGIFKFATMLKDSPNMGTGSITLRDDPRVTPVGKYLRMAKINELPQLLNVLLGQMTLVGPRPFVDATFAAYPAEVQQRVYAIRPGLTGAGSIVYRDEEAIISNSDLAPAECYRTVIAPHKGALELWYQDHRSFWVDVKLLVLTAICVVRPNTEGLLYRAFPSAPRPEQVDSKTAASVS